MQRTTINLTPVSIDELDYGPPLTRPNIVHVHAWPSRGSRIVPIVSRKYHTPPKRKSTIPLPFQTSMMTAGFGGTKS